VKKSPASTAAKAPAASRARKAPAPTKPALAARAGRGKLAEVAAVLVDARRKDIDALKQAGMRSYEGTRIVVRRQVEQLKQTLGEWQAVIQVMRLAGPRESVAQLDELGRGALQQALESIRELADLAVQNQSEAIQILRRRIDEDLDEVARQLRPGKAATRRVPSRRGAR